MNSQEWLFERVTSILNFDGNYFDPDCEGPTQILQQAIYKLFSEFYSFSTY